MVRVYGRHSKKYVKGYGYMPVYISGNGMGQVLLESAKAFGKRAIPLAKKVWAQLTPDMRDAVISGGVNLATEKAENLGKKISSAVGSLGSSAEAKLGELIGKKESKTISKDAKKIIKKMLKQNKKKARKQIAKQISQASVLTKEQKRNLKKGNKAILSKLLLGKGLRLM